MDARLSRFLRRQKGFTLVEALVTMAVLGVGLAGVARLQANLMESGGQIKARTEGIALAQQKLEEMRNFVTAFPYTTLDDGTTSGLTGTLASYDVSWTITPAPLATYYEVTVTASWADTSGNQSVSLHSIISSLSPSSAGHLLADAAP